MTKESDLGWADLQEITSELIGDNRPGTDGWDPDDSVTNRVNDRFMQALRENGGKVPGELENVPCLIITTTGAKTGKKRSVPLACHEHDGRLLVIASMGGARNNPPWYHNLVANPEVTVEKDGETFDAVAVIARGADRDACFDSVCKALPVFAEYQARAGRTIPVVELRRR
ncbi:MAG: nitroreductase/quinone reductase family protein [Gammaproteobacteria bacterium]